MNRHKATFYLGEKKITFEEALKYVRKHKDANVNSSSEKNTVVISPQKSESDSSLSYVIEMSKKNAKFFYEDEEIRTDKAISLVKRKAGLLSVNAKNINSEQPLIYISKKGPLVGVLATNELVVIVNGKTPLKGQITLSKKEFKDLELTMKKLKVKSFMLKIEGEKSQTNTGNNLNEASKSYVKDVSEGSMIQLFNIKSSNGIKLKPILVTIKK
jgi:hypothetical protein